MSCWSILPSSYGGWEWCYLSSSCILQLFSALLSLLFPPVFSLIVHTAEVVVQRIVGIRHFTFCVELCCILYIYNRAFFRPLLHEFIANSIYLLWGSPRQNHHKTTGSSVPNSHCIGYNCWTCHHSPTFRKTRSYLRTRINGYSAKTQMVKRWNAVWSSAGNVS